MGLMDKIKNILFEEDTVEIPIITKEDYPKEEEKKEKKEEKPVIKEEVKTPIKEEYTINKRFSNHYEEEEEKPTPKIYDEERVVKDSFRERREEIKAPKEEKVEIKKPEVKESPFLPFDENEFERMSSTYHSYKKEEKRKPVPRRDAVLYAKSTPVEEEPKKKFHPSPIISPVYGILDKNYRKDDFLPTSSSEGTLPKIMDVDSVRKKAFGTLEEEIESKLKAKEELEKTKELEKLEEDKTLGDVIQENLEKERIKGEEIPHYNIEEIKITSYLDDEEDSSIEDVIDNSIDASIDAEEEVSLKEPEVLEPKEEAKAEPLKVEEEPDEEVEEDVTEPEEELNGEEVGNTTLESDLFDLIDSMYEKEEE